MLLQKTAIFRHKKLFYGAMTPETWKILVPVYSELLPLTRCVVIIYDF